MTTGDAHGVIFNVDSVLRLGSPRRQLGRGFAPSAARVSGIAVRRWPCPVSSAPCRPI